MNVNKNIVKLLEIGKNNTDDNGVIFIFIKKN